MLRIKPSRQRLSKCSTTEPHTAQLPRGSCSVKLVLWTSSSVHRPDWEKSLGKPWQRNAQPPNTFLNKQWLLINTVQYDLFSTTTTTPESFRPWIAVTTQHLLKGSSVRLQPLFLVPQLFRRSRGQMNPTVTACCQLSPFYASSPLGLTGSYKVHRPGYQSKCTALSQVIPAGPHCLDTGLWTEWRKNWLLLAVFIHPIEVCSQDPQAVLAPVLSEDWLVNFFFPIFVIP